MFSCNELAVVLFNTKYPTGSGLSKSSFKDRTDLNNITNLCISIHPHPRHEGATPDQLTDISLHSACGGVDSVHLVAWDAAGPDHATITQVHGPGPLEYARHRQPTIVLVALVPACLRYGCTERRKTNVNWQLCRENT